MNVITSERGTVAWREAHRCRVSASDATALMARSSSKRWRTLVERVVLDFEGHPLHTDEHPDPWVEQHEADLVVALARYRIYAGSVLATGFCTSSKFDWLGASPHGLVGHYGCVHLRPRQRLRSFHEGSGLTTAERARVQLTMLVCERLWCDVADFWDGAGSVPDKLRVLPRIDFDYPWLSTNVLPRFVALWQEVRKTLDARGVVASRSCELGGSGGLQEGD